MRAVGVPPRARAHRTTLRAALLGAGLCCTLAPGACRPPAAGPPRVNFTTVADGIEYARLRHPLEAATRLEGHAFRIDLESAGLRVLAAGGPSTRRRVATIARAPTEAVAVNASFFDEHDRAMGLVVDQGNVLARGRIGSWGALVVENRRARIVSGAELPARAPSSDPPGGSERLRPHLVVQGTPRLVIEGEVPKLKEQVAERTVVCAEGRFVLLIVVTRPIDATRLARFLATPRAQGGAGCTSALNLDGGPSTQLSARLGDVRIEVEGGWGVPNALVALPGLPEAERREASGPAAPAARPENDPAAASGARPE